MFLLLTPSTTRCVCLVGVSSKQQTTPAPFVISADCVANNNLPSRLSFLLCTVCIDIDDSCTYDTDCCTDPDDEVVCAQNPSVTFYSDYICQGELSSCDRCGGQLPRNDTSVSYPRDCLSILLIYALLLYVALMDIWVFVCRINLRYAGYRLAVCRIISHALGVTLFMFCFSLKQGRNGSRLLRRLKIASVGCTSIQSF